jgi:hypothetical protein
LKKYKKYFVRALDTNYPQDSLAILNEIDDAFSGIEKDIRFARSSKNPMDRRLDISGYFLALIQVLDRRGETYERIREISLEVARAYVEPANKLHQWFKRLPVKLIGTRFSTRLLVLLDRRLKIRDHSDGFVARIVTDKQETFGLGYGVDILECGICKLFERYDCGAFASILCEVDHITTNLAGLELVRSGTIATGADKCDFRFKNTASDRVVEQDS